METGLNQIDTDLWDLAMRREEYTPKKLDKHGRFLAAYSSFKELCVPIVSKTLFETGYSIDYPDNKKFAVCLTHDVDDIFPPYSHIFLSIIRYIRDLKVNKLSNLVQWKYKGVQFSPYFNFKEIADLETKYNAKSTFFFMTAEEDIIRRCYNIEETGEIIGIISDEGFDIGLHGGYYSFNNLVDILKEKHKLEKICKINAIGYRSHYLRFKVPDTWELLSKAGFKYDSTVGYADSIGFRSGMCHPFSPVNLNTGRKINIMEIPLAIMDVTLFNYMKLNTRDAWIATKNFIDNVEKYRGVLTLSWHNYVFNCPFRKSWYNLYIKILKYLNEKNAWITSCDEIYRWYNRHG